MKLVILDRDGVINVDSDQFIKSPEEWKPIPGSLEAIARLNHSGYRVVVATNQSGVGRGLFDMAALNAIHDKMYRALGAVRRSHRRGVLLPAAPPITTATAASPSPACSRRSRSASTWS